MTDDVYVHLLFLVLVATSVDNTFIQAVCSMMVGLKKTPQKCDKVKWNDKRN